jgi:glycosyltransferase involved in cell wall biosynthesis
VYEREQLPDLQLEALLEKISPDIIYVSGWMDKGYVAAAGKYKNKIPVVAGFDTQWTGSFKQWLTVVLSPFRIRKYFSHCWVPGGPQRKYAQKLGFEEKRILGGLYSCDHKFFSGLISQYSKNENTRPLRFIYAGRYYSFKGIHDLFEAFKELKEEGVEWELWCIGTGDVKPLETEGIRHFGFVQPSALPELMKECDVFVLPSHYEPWGVVVHEFAAAGFPLICSDAVGAASAFLQHDINGYIYKAGSVSGLKAVMKKMVSTSASQRREMSAISSELASSITPETWAATIFNVKK